MSLRVAVVQGGPSTEAEVSRASADAVTSALRAAGHVAERVELDEGLPAALGALAPDVVFPIAHGALGEDGSLQGLLEVLGLPYVGSEVLPSALAMNKGVARGVFAAAGLPVAPGVTLSPRDGDAPALARRARDAVGRAVVVKPSTSGSAIGIVRLGADEPDARVAEAIDAAFALSPSVVIERFVRGREVTCGVLERDGGPAALPPTEIRAIGHAFYTFEARYGAGASAHVCPAPAPDPVRAELARVAVAAHAALGCRDLSRADFVLGDEEASAPDRLTLLEVNTLPGFTATSLFPEAAAVAGLPLAALCDHLVRRAHGRGRRGAPAARALPR